MHRQNLPDRNQPTLPGVSPGKARSVIEGVFGILMILSVLACGALALLVGEGGW